MLYVNDLEFHYGTHQVLTQLSFSLSSGRIGLLAGRNGAGKSTLLRCIAGWVTGTAGTIRVNNISCEDQERAYRKQVTLVPDTPDFYDELTAWEHLQFVAQLNRVSSWQETAQQLLKQFGIFEQKDNFPFTFSRGMRYKLALAMALLVKPPLLLLDEPFGSLDPLANQLLWRLLKEFAVGGGTVLYSTHILEGQAPPDVILHLAQGQIKAIVATGRVNLTEILRDVE